MTTTDKPKAKRRKRRLVDARAPKVLKGVLAGKPLRQAAVDAGFSPAWASAGFYQSPVAEWVKQQIEARQKRALARSAVHTDQIVGSLVEIMEASVADILPECEVLQRARANGVDHLIKKISIVPIKVGEKKKKNKDGSVSSIPIIEQRIDLEMYSRLDAISQLRDNFGMKQEPRANTYEESRRQEVEKSIHAIMDKDGVDKPTAARMLKDALGPESPLLPTVSKYVN